MCKYYALSQGIAAILWQWTHVRNAAATCCHSNILPIARIYGLLVTLRQQCATAILSQQICNRTTATTLHQCPLLQCCKLLLNIAAIEAIAAISPHFSDAYVLHILYVIWWTDWVDRRPLYHVIVHSACNVHSRVFYP